MPGKSYSIRYRGVKYTFDESGSQVRLWDKASQRFYPLTSQDRKAYTAWKYNQRRLGNTDVKISKLSRIQPHFQKYFAPSGGSRMPYIGENGRLRPWAQPLSVTGKSSWYEESNYGWHRPYKGERGFRHHQLKDNRLWGTDIDKAKIGVWVLKGSKAWLKQLNISKYQVMLQAEYFRMAVGYRAIKVFQTSFKKQQFNATGSHKWAPLAEYTKRKRLKRRGNSKYDSPLPGMRILQEYGDLYRSIKMEQETIPGRKVVRVFTDVVHANARKGKKHSICYAGLHNDPGIGDTYGPRGGRRTARPYIQRQFMGFSDHIDAFAEMIMKRYLLDSVFLVPHP